MRIETNTKTENMETYLITQVAIDEKFNFPLRANNITVTTIVRIVNAETKESAIGKFVIGTQDVKAQRKLEIDCYKLSELKSL